jgi:hypothetical protein
VPPGSSNPGLLRRSRRPGVNKFFYLALTVVLVIPALFAGCSRVNPGPVTTREFDYTDFSKVEVASAFEVEIVQSDTWSISVTAQETLFDHINITKNDDTLEINLQWGWGTWVSSWGYQRPKARISMPELYMLSLSGASKGSIAGLNSQHQTDFSVSGASSLDMDIEGLNSVIQVSGASHITGKIKASDLRLEVTGASRADLSGSADSLTLEASGASNAVLGGVVVGSADIDLSGASKATVSPEDTMKVVLSGASSLTYSGSPELQAIEVSGASTIHKK